MKDVGWKGYNLIWLRKDGWTDDDAPVINSFAAALGDPNAPKWAIKAAAVSLGIWADEGLPEGRYL